MAIMSHICFCFLFQGSLPLPRLLEVQREDDNLNSHTGGQPITDHSPSISHYLAIHEMAPCPTEHQVLGHMVNRWYLGGSLGG